MSQTYFIKINKMLDVDGIKIPIGFVLDQNENDILEFCRFAEEFMIDLRLNDSNDIPTEMKEKFIDMYEKNKTKLFIHKSFKIENIDESNLNELKEKIKNNEILNNPNAIVQYKIHEIQMESDDNLNKLKEFINDYLESPENYPPMLDKGFSIVSSATAGSGPEMENDNDNEE